MLELNEKNKEEQEVKELYKGLLSYCCFLSGDKWDGEDLAQETMVKAMQTYESLTPALLKKIAYHKWIDEKRKRSRETVGETDHHTLTKESRKEEVEALLNSLTPKQAVILTLKEAFQYKISEISSILEMTEPGVKALLKRARTKLRGENREEEINNQELVDAISKSVQWEDPAPLLSFLKQKKAFAPMAHIVFRSYSSLNIAS
ncbi:sigma factor-like helix-turn-helix DNA-binding protein [Priestia endophytica]|uniref:sigma factor-like helix-turn-helix DNA-binding protein n=1 Tax=Priestia endophytica TaxID=135735 RepID=UPI00124E22A5|nr:sigma factor-like helix-turn-helix DNA-binding protein [Priestia endophytica]KAB2494129.1 RNA polymerase subunit sigma [Priestia endophytica]